MAYVATCAVVQHTMMQRTQTCCYSARKRRWEDRASEWNSMVADFPPMHEPSPNPPSSIRQNLGILDLHRPNPEERVLKDPGRRHVISIYALSNKHCAAAVLTRKKSDDISSTSTSSKVCKVGSRCSSLISLSSLKKQDSIRKCLSGREMKDCRCRCFDYRRQDFRE